MRHRGQPELEMTIAFSLGVYPGESLQEGGLDVSRQQRRDDMAVSSFVLNWLCSPEDFLRASSGPSTRLVVGGRQSPRSCPQRGSVRQTQTSKQLLHQILRDLRLRKAGVGHGGTFIQSGWVCARRSLEVRDGTPTSLNTSLLALCPPAPCTVHWLDITTFLFF